MSPRRALDAYLSDAAVRQSILSSIRRRRKCSREDALDLFSEAICQAYQSIERIRSLDSLPAWFAVLVRNTICNDIARIAKERSLVATYFENVYYAGRGDSPERLFLFREQVARLRSYLFRLQALDRKILEGFYLEDETLPEISETLRMPYEAVKLQKFRAKQRLLALYKADSMQCGATLAG